jgi:hypothetical protein
MRSSPTNAKVDLPVRGFVSNYAEKIPSSGEYCVSSELLVHAVKTSASITHSAICFLIYSPKVRLFR